MDLVTSAIEPIKFIAEKVYELFMKEKSNKEQCHRLAKCVGALVQTLDALKRQRDLIDHSEELKQRLGELKSTLETAEAMLLKRESTSQFKKLLKATQTSDKLDALFQQLSAEHKDLALLLQVEQRAVAGATIRKVDAVQETVEVTANSMVAVHDSIDSTLRKVNSMDEKMDDSQRQMDTLHNKVAKSQETIEALNEKMEKLIERDPGASCRGQPSSDPGPSSGGQPSPAPGPSRGGQQELSTGVPGRPAATPLPQDADKLLSAVRSRFVEKASLSLIKQLLDDLQEDRVLNSEEAESVLEEQTARADRARCLIDSVRKKGLKASEKMITHVRERDPTLSETLGLV